MNDNKSIPTKKRKANDGRATAGSTHDVISNTNDGGFLSSWFGYFSGQRGDAASSGQSPTENNTSQLDRMEQIMMKMEEKLATVSSLESRCEQLEKKCSSLENILETTTQSTKEHTWYMEQKYNLLETRLGDKIDSVHVKLDRSLKFHEYNEMIVKNQDWKYSAAVDTTDEWIYNGYSEADAEHLAWSSQNMKSVTTKMRKGEFTLEWDGSKGVYLDMSDYDPPFSDVVNNELLPHWKEFAAALKQFTPAINLLSDDCESCFHFYCVQLNHDAMLLIKEALVGKPFQYLIFTNNNLGEGDPAGMSVDAILDIVESNKHLQKLEISLNRISNQHIERLCSVVHTHPALVELDLSNSAFEPGIGDAILASLLTLDDLKLEKLILATNNITSGVSTLLAHFLASNPRLKELNLHENYHLNDRDAALIANALRTNSSLRNFSIGAMGITDVGVEALGLALCDGSSLNSAADSNHTCILALEWYDIDNYNWDKQGHINRGRKIYSILSSRNETMSNVQHFGNIDVKILPIMLEAVQKYATYVNKYVPKVQVKPLSIVYEVMRKWGVGKFET